MRVYPVSKFRENVSGFTSLVDVEDPGDFIDRVVEFMSDTSLTVISDDVIEMVLKGAPIEVPRDSFVVYPTEELEFYVGKIPTESGNVYAIIQPFLSERAIPMLLFTFLDDKFNTKRERVLVPVKFAPTVSVPIVFGYEAMILDIVDYLIGMMNEQFKEVLSPLVNQFRIRSRPTLDSFRLDYRFIASAGRSRIELTVSFPSIIYYPLSEMGRMINEQALRSVLVATDFLSTVKRSVSAYPDRFPPNIIVEIFQPIDLLMRSPDGYIVTFSDGREERGFVFWDIQETVAEAINYFSD